ncbi:MAG: hypothetical protein C4B57_11255 [Deltaproteobacteria bacterium]|nr:MAG: hypothetical protein C4B57_11255 [Deltaproteobacteria bacterium]
MSRRVYATTGPNRIPQQIFHKRHREELRILPGQGSLKKKLLFRRLNFVDFDFPFRSPIDIIFCRNVMIYFDMEIKKRLIDNFFRILGQDGFLCLGASESLIGVDDRFAPVGYFTYQKRG